MKIRSIIDPQPSSFGLDVGRWRPCASLPCRRSLSRIGAASGIARADGEERRAERRRGRRASVGPTHLLSCSNSAPPSPTRRNERSGIGGLGGVSGAPEGLQYFSPDATMAAEVHDHAAIGASQRGGANAARAIAPVLRVGPRSRFTFGDLGYGGSIDMGLVLPPSRHHPDGGDPVLAIPQTPPNSPFARRRRPSPSSLGVAPPKFCPQPNCPPRGENACPFLALEP
jgi:hypothetical protein